MKRLCCNEISDLSKKTKPSPMADDGSIITGVTHSQICPILQMQMRSIGQMRPMISPCGHVISFNGMFAYLYCPNVDVRDLSAQAKPFPIAGCRNTTLVMGAMKDYTEFAKTLPDKEA